MSLPRHSNRKWMISLQAILKILTCSFLHALSIFNHSSMKQSFCITKPMLASVLGYWKSHGSNNQLLCLDSGVQFFLQYTSYFPYIGISPRCLDLLIWILFLSKINQTAAHANNTMILEYDKLQLVCQNELAALATKCTFTRRKRHFTADLPLTC